MWKCAATTHSKCSWCNFKWNLLEKMLSVEKKNFGILIVIAKRLWLLWSGNIAAKQSLFSDVYHVCREGSRVAVDYNNCTLINMCIVLCGKVVCRKAAHSLPHAFSLIASLAAKWVAGQRCVRMGLQIMNKSAVSDNKTLCKCNFRGTTDEWLWC